MRAPGAFHAQDDVAQQLVLCAAQLVFRHRLLLQPPELVGDQLDHLQRPVRRRARVHAQHAGVAVRIQVAVDRVGQAALLAHGLEEPRAHAAAQHRVQQQRAIAPVARDGQRRHAHTKLHLFERLLVAQHDLRAGGRRQAGILRHAGRHASKRRRTSSTNR